MSSGKLDFRVGVRNDKFYSIKVYSGALNSTINWKTTWDSSLTDFSRISQNFNDSYHKAFEIHLLLLRNEDLSNEEKLELCKIERNYIKLYLKTIIKKNYI